LNLDRPNIASTTIISIIRLHSLVIFSNSKNPTYDNVPTAYWSVLEVYVGIFSISMPYIRRFCARVFPSLFGSHAFTLDRKTQEYRNNRSKNDLRSSKTNVGLNTMIRGSAIMKTVDTVIENQSEDDDEVQLVDLEMQRMEDLKIAWGVKGAGDADSSLFERDKPRTPSTYCPRQEKRKFP
jgi:hypothetical protein